MTVCVIALTFGVLLLTSQVTKSGDVRHTAFANALWGTWSPSQELCDKRHQSAISIAETQFSNSEGTCDVQWIIERAAAHGPTYGVHARCVDPSRPNKTRAVDLIFWPQGSDRISIGKSFDDLKVYQRCPG